MSMGISLPMNVLPKITGPEDASELIPLSLYLIIELLMIGDALST